METTRFRPDDLVTSGGGSKYLGFVPVAIMDYQDKSEDFDWADVFIEVTLQIEHSQYPRRMQLCGSYDKEPNGNIKSSSLLKRVYYLFDAIGFQGGPDKAGNWVDADGEAISDIARILSNEHATNPLEPKFEYYAYVYKKEPTKEGKSYTEVYPRLVPNTEKGRAELESYIAFLKGKNLIKEFDESTAPNGVSQPTATAGEPTRF
tara:strand:- start:59 stop:673 length:615 start_codon:yes stop_codon:yes gene_type:complete